MDNSQNEIFIRIRTVVDILILFFSLFGNILIILSIWKMKKLRKVFTSILIVNLAICDILLVLFGVLPDLLTLYRGDLFSSHIISCKLLMPLSTFQVNAISLIMVFIAIERYITIKYNTRSGAGTIKIILVTIFIHLYSLATVLPYYLTLDLAWSSDIGWSCVERWSVEAGKNYTIFLFLVQIGVPLPVMVALYALSWRIIERRNTKTIKFMDNVQLKSHHYPFIVKYFCCCFLKNKIAFSQCRSDLKRQLSITSEVSIARQKQTKYYLNMFTVVVLLFAICMLPNQITWFYMAFEPKPLSLYVTVLFYWLTFSNAVLNPWIYAGCNPFFKRAYRGFIRKLLSPCRKKDRYRHIISMMQRTRAPTVVQHHVTEKDQSKTDNDFLWITPWSVQDHFGGGLKHKTVSKNDVNIDPYDLYDPDYTEKKLPRITPFIRPKMSVTTSSSKKHTLDLWQEKAQQSYKMVLSYTDQNICQKLDRNKSFLYLSENNLSSSPKSQDSSPFFWLHEAGKERPKSVAVFRDRLDVSVYEKLDSIDINSNNIECGSINIDDEKSAEIDLEDVVFNVTLISFNEFNDLSETHC
ncbi:melatonin receptor type 1A-like [Clytia hemisphaerica]|uniref:melatonin receptor type 1A-like n=1 Tax=Clytia hemisphaerica TaxID=252671 RepID=UPI0034D6DCA9